MYDTAYRKHYRKKAAGRAQSIRARFLKYARMHRVPEWLTSKQVQQIVDFYVHCPLGMTVDHIYPLRGIYVSGLHHPDNLQYLPT